MRLGQLQSSLICLLAALEVGEKVAVFGCVYHNGVVMGLGGVGTLYLTFLSFSGVATKLGEWWGRSKG